MQHFKGRGCENFDISCAYVRIDLCTLVCVCPNCSSRNVDRLFLKSVTYLVINRSSPFEQWGEGGGASIFETRTVKVVR